MDDVPPGPTALEPRRPALSVVVPVYNGGRDFERCLRGLQESRGVDFELIVVDDGSTDDSATLAENAGASVLRNERPLGPASARNAGAEAANADLVFFLDADVAVHDVTLARATARFEADPGLTALFGSYDDEPPAPGLVSRFRNLLHHYTHQQGAFVDDTRPAHTFWTGCGAIRRQAFLDVGGFDPRLYVRPAIEDIEFGYRLTGAGHRVVLARDVLGTHLKRWTLGSVVKTDIFQRGVPWMLLLKRRGVVETDLNVRPGQKVCVAATCLAVCAGLLAPFWPWLLGLVLAACVAVLALNRSFYRFLARKGGPAFASACLPLHLIYYLCCGASVVIATVLWHAGTGRRSSARNTGRPMAVDPASKRKAARTGRGPRTLRGLCERGVSRWTGK